jgi:hypothetical protein
MSSKRQAEIIEQKPSWSEDGRRYAGYRIARDETGETHCLIDGSRNGTQHGVGTKGTVEYFSSAWDALWHFRAGSDPVASGRPGGA